jgi:hypothetical protein
MVHAESGVGQRGDQILGQPRGVLELMENRISDRCMICVQKGQSTNIEDFCEWDFGHWAVHNVEGDHKAVIVVLDLLGVHGGISPVGEVGGPGGKRVLGRENLRGSVVEQDRKNTKEPRRSRRRGRKRRRKSS